MHVHDQARRCSRKQKTQIDRGVAPSRSISSRRKIGQYLASPACRSHVTIALSVGMCAAAVAGITPSAFSFPLASRCWRCSLGFFREACGSGCRAVLLAAGPPAPAPLRVNSSRRAAGMPVRFAQRFICSVWFFSFVMSFPHTTQWHEAAGAGEADGAGEGKAVGDEAAGSLAGRSLRLSQHLLAWCSRADSEYPDRSRPQTAHAQLLASSTPAARPSTASMQALTWAALAAASMLPRGARHTAQASAPASPASGACRFSLSLPGIMLLAYLRHVLAIDLCRLPLPSATAARARAVQYGIRIHPLMVGGVVALAALTWPR